MTEESRLGARNPKVVRFTISLDETVNRRLEVVADRLGQNKGTTAATLMALGLTIFEPLLQIGLEKYENEAIADKSGEVAQAIRQLTK